MPKNERHQIHDRFCKWVVAKDTAYASSLFQWKIGEMPSKIFNWDKLCFFVSCVTTDGI